eukprot:TRINITY_DN14184_c0_g1_i1.p1 TRINITY_DN14184_c0_g1~~TRINITY_DN14184_c0_g1_i1.p1  ORF type:complete len:195 (+),score=31.79 TRINITY_DN14184_c0_g1_i1:368-952(+)
MRHSLRTSTIFLFSVIFFGLLVNSSCEYTVKGTREASSDRVISFLINRTLARNESISKPEATNISDSSLVLKPGSSSADYRDLSQANTTTDSATNLSVKHSERFDHESEEKEKKKKSAMSITVIAEIIATIVATIFACACFYCRAAEEQKKRREGAGTERFRNVTLNLMRNDTCLLYTSPSPRDGLLSRMPSSA